MIFKFSLKRCETFCTLISFQQHTGITHEVRYSVFPLQLHSPLMISYQLIPWQGSEWCTLKMYSCVLLFCSVALQNNSDITTLASSVSATLSLHYHWIFLCVLECTNNAVKLAHDDCSYPWNCLQVICSLSLKKKIPSKFTPKNRQ